MKLFLGKKLSMTQMYKEGGKVVPATSVQTGEAIVVQVKTEEKDGYSAVQLGFSQGNKNISKSVKAHVNGLVERPALVEMRVDDASKFSVGQKFGLDNLVIGERISVSAVSKGHGYQGVVKRHHFSGAPKTHGHKHDLRSPGSIGSTDAQRVFPGKRMAGRMGADRVTILNLEIVHIDKESGIVMIKGAVPGARNGIIEIKAQGDMKEKI